MVRPRGCCSSDPRGGWRCRPPADDGPVAEEGAHEALLARGGSDAGLGLGVFDAIVSVDAFEHIGTDVRLLPALLPALKGGGWLAMATPALRDDPYVEGIPAHVERVVGWEAAAWHAPDWWARHWGLSGMLTEVQARWQEGGRDDCLLWELARQQLAGETEPSAVVDMLRADEEEHVGFAWLTARKR